VRRSNHRVAKLLVGTLLVAGAAVPGSAAAASPSAGAVASPETITWVVPRAELEAKGLSVPVPSLVAAGSGTPSGTVAPAAGCLFDCIHIRNVRYVGTNQAFVTRAQANGPGTLKLSVKRTVSNGFTATVGVNSELVTASVGFNVTASQSVTYSYSTKVPDGKCWTINAYNLADDYTFEVWVEPFIGSDVKVGTGRAWEFGGVKYVLVKSC
jgi:hypothetical protein